MERKTNLKVKLVGQDGNIFNLVGIVQRELMMKNHRDLAKELPMEICKCTSYEDALCKLDEYVQIY